MHNVGINGNIYRYQMYKFDETGYAMGLIATAKVVSRAEMTGRPFHVQPGSRERVERPNDSMNSLFCCFLFLGLEFHCS